MRKILLVLCLILVFSQGALAFNVSKMTIDPSGSLVPGTPVVVEGIIDFTPSSNVTFESGSELEFTTELEKPKWTWTLILDGVENPRPQEGGQSLSLSGFDISYPNTVHESVRFKLEGTTSQIKRDESDPYGTVSERKTIIRIREIDEYSKIIPESVFEINTTVISKSCCSEPISFTLKKFRTHIEEKSDVGVNTTEAEAKYADAITKADAANALPTTQFAAALSSLTAAKNDIAEGERLLDKAWAEKEVADAQVPINNVDIVLGGIKTNRTIPPQLREIISKRESAVDYIRTANDQIAAGNYSTARESARIALALGNESYTSALEYQQQKSRSTPGAPLSPVCCVVAIGVVELMVILHRKKRQFLE